MAPKRNWPPGMLAAASERLTVRDECPLEVECINEERLEARGWRLGGLRAQGSGLRAQG